MPSYKPVTAVLRALEVLGAVSRHGVSTVSQVARDTGLNASTVVRCLETLESAGFVLKDHEGPSYVLTGKVLELSTGFEPYRELGVLAGPILWERKAEWPSDLAVFDGDAMIVAATSRSEGQLFYNRRPGFRAPILGTSLGRAYLAYCADDERERALSLAARMPEAWNAPARARPLIDKILGEVRHRGFAVMTDEYSASAYNNLVWAMAVPILVADRAVASVNITLLRSAVTLDQAVERYLDPLRATAAQIAAKVAERRAVRK
jgi:IclR family transcriptional regulator, mhp operon transcriptional activator